MEASCYTNSGRFQVHPWALSCSDSLAGKYTSTGACTNFHGNEFTSMETSTNFHGSNFTSMELLLIVFFQASFLLSSPTHIHILVGGLPLSYLLDKPWSQVSSPPGTNMPSVCSAFPLVWIVIDFFLLTLSRSPLEITFYEKQIPSSTHVHSVTLEPTKSIGHEDNLLSHRRRQPI